MQFLSFQIILVAAVEFPGFNWIFPELTLSVVNHSDSVPT